MARYFIEFSYLGSAYSGLQIQPNALTVQEVLQNAMQVVLRVPYVKLVVAGRTDAGVHGEAMMAHFDVPDDTPELGERFLRALNGCLPADVAIGALYKPTLATLHARFSAVSRAYTYRFVFHKSPFHSPIAWYVRHSLDIEAMHRAADAFMHFTDFASLCKAHGDNETTLCQLYHSYLAPWPPHGLAFHVRANRFLRGMVRAMVGILVEVGRGTMGPQDVRRLLEAKDRTLGPLNAPANGLSLTEVRYPPNSLQLICREGIANREAISRTLFGL